MSNIEETTLVTLTAEIVSAYVTKNRLPATGLPDLIASVSNSVRKLGEPAAPPEAEQVPAVNPKKSVHADHIVCLEDGKKFKSMKRHLGSHGLTPQQYRAKWGLPGRLPDDGAELFGHPLRHGQGHRTWKAADRPQASS